MQDQARMRVLRRIRRYYDNVHDFLPFLPHDKEVMFSNLEQTSLPVILAYQGALRVFSHPGVYSTIPLQSSEIEDHKAEYARRVSDLQHDAKSTQTPVEKLVVLQTILLMIFAAEFHSPATAGRRCVSRHIELHALMGLSDCLFYDADIIQEIVDGTFRRWEHQLSYLVISVWYANVESCLEKIATNTIYLPVARS